MNIFKLLTYDVREHNIAFINDAVVADNTPSFVRSLWRRLKRAMHYKSFSYLMRQQKRPFYDRYEPLKSIVFAPISKNNKRVLEPLWNRLTDGTYTILSENGDPYIPMPLVYFYSWIYLWPFFKCYITANKRERQIIRANFDEFFETMGYVVVTEILFAHSNVKLIVLSNDHCAYPRAMVKTARNLGMRTMYLQHCSVTNTFPALPFDYSFLDGEESYLKYMEAGIPHGLIYLCGNPRYDITTQIKGIRNGADNVIGVALNTIDKEDKVKTLCEELLDEGYNEIVVRPHPAQTIDRSWYLQRGVDFSDSKIENPFEFLSHVGILIAGETGIHLDAAMMGVRSICYNTIDAAPLDWYSYIKNGLIPYAANMDELLALLSNKDIDWQKTQQAKARWYNAAYGTKHEGHIGEMLADFIRYDGNGDIAGFDEKYGFIKKEICDYQVKVYKE